MVSVLIPTCNAASFLGGLLGALIRQRLENFEVIVVDSSSTDGTVSIAKAYGVQTHVIPKDEFDHGGTRTFVGRVAKGDILVYLTQDALPVVETTVATLVQPFYEDDRIGITFGRQLPYVQATPFAQHLRYFNYPDQSYTRTFDDRASLGIRAAFCSNSFAAYRRSALEMVGWFQEGLIMGEDLHACAKMLKRGYRVRYVADAVVYHSHNYTIRQDLKRYFDLGRFFTKESWLLDEFGKPETEAHRFIRSEWRFLIKQGLVHYLPLSVLRLTAKFLGYRLGQWSKYLPKWAAKRLTMLSS